MNIEQNYKLWLENVLDSDLKKELTNMSKDQIEDAFYKDLEFGTGGLRGVIGAGTNRMNIYTVRKVSEGISRYIINNFSEKDRKIAISYDSRINSDVFAKAAAEVYASNGILVYIYPTLSPVPTLSFATRYLCCAVGVMITASHNPKEYNGYKVYGEDGCQFTTKSADETLEYINSIDIFKDVKTMSFDEGFEKNLISYIKPSIITSFIEHVKNESLIKNEDINKDVSIVYSPLNGTGLYTVTRALKEMGYTNIKVVEEQQFPNGYFHTCPYPNPEIKEAMQLGMDYAKKYNADLLLATDPDCDRVGIAVKDKDSSYRLFSGNETGVLLLNYICERRIALKMMPKDAVMVKTIVTTDMAERVAKHYGVKCVNVLTGFKYIGEQIGLLEKNSKENDYIFGFEESYGYLSGTYVRDKDAVNASVLICEMFAYYKSKNITLIDKLNELYAKFGYTYNTLYSFKFDGSKGFVKMQEIMNKFRDNILSIAGINVINKLDYINGLDNLPKSNVIKFYLENNISVVVRPSGTEPKLKTYISVTAKDYNTATKIENNLHNYLLKFME